MIVRLIIRDTDEGLRATLWTQNDPGEAESKSSEAFLVKSKAEASEGEASRASLEAEDAGSCCYGGIAGDLLAERAR